MDTIADLIRSLRDEDPEIRETATRRLMEIGAPAVLPLCEAVSGEAFDPEAPRTPDEWLERLSSPDDRMRQRAEKQLIRLGEAAIPALSRALQDEVPQVRHRAARLLRQIQYDAVLSLQGASEALHDRSVYVREAAVRSLSRHGGAAVPALCVALEDPDMFVRRIAAEALGQLGDRAAAPKLAALLEIAGGDTGPVIARSLGQIGSAAAVPALCSALESSDHTTQLACARALAEIADSDPTPGLRAALPLLERHRRGDLLWRRRFAHAIRRIEAATAGLSDLPLPSQQHGPPNSAVLPTPSRLL
jgi:HEAT repeat protein